MYAPVILQVSIMVTPWIGISCFEMNVIELHRLCKYVRSTHSLLLQEKSSLHFAYSLSLSLSKQKENTWNINSDLTSINKKEIKT